ncbi:hypothetical protein [Massilia sp. TWR1-2-2]|uniref:hypothetical protein n=1 Tax=Massilia sp. TWR1-2-2 TaxID=2804584 RepID=UPI003CF6E2E0
MLKEPKISVALVVNEDRTILMVRRTDDDGEPSWVRWDLRELEREGYLALCQRVGDTALRMLSRAHPDEFAKFPLLAPPKLTAFDELCSLVVELMHRSTTEKTTAYVAAIDAIFARHCAELGQTDLPETWQSIRIRVMSRPAIE